jgi:hypothetical protein
VGEYIDDRNVPHGFLLDQHGRFTRLDVPDAKATNAAKINNQGQIVGAYSLPWSHSARLLAYRSVRCQATGSRSSSTAGYTGA